MLKLILLSAFSHCIHPTLSTFSFMSRPTNLRVSLSSDPTLVNIFWSPPEEPNGEITGYYILYTNNNLLSDMKWEREKVFGQKTTIVLPKLIPYSKYFLKVKAIIDGTTVGSPSNVIEFITKSSSPHNRLSSLSKPKILQVVAGKVSSAVEIIWRAPKDPTGRIKTYEIYYTSGDMNMPNNNLNVKIIDKFEGIDDINDVEEMSSQIYGLLPNTNYKFIIKVKTSEDNVGSFSSVFEFLTKPVDEYITKPVDEYSGNNVGLMSSVFQFLNKPSFKTSDFYRTCVQLFEIFIGPFIIIFFIYLLCTSTRGREIETERKNSQSGKEGRSKTVSTLFRKVEDCRRKLEEMKELIRSNAKDIKALVKEAECLLLLGEISSTMISLENIKKLNIRKDFYESNMEKLMKLKHLVEQADNYFKLSNYSSALYTIKKAISISPASVKFNLMKAEFLVMLGSYSEAQIIIDEIFKFDKLNIEGLYLSGLSLYYQDEIQQSIQHFEKLLRLCPDHEKVSIVYKKAKTLFRMKEEGNEAFNEGNYQRACETYSSALSIDPLNKMINAKLYFNRCLARAKMNQLNEALDDCYQALNIDENYMKAHHKLAKLLMAKGMFEEAVREYEWIYSAHPSRGNKSLLDAAKMKLKNKDYYKILGVSRTAGIKEIRKAYQELALKHHPDKHPNASESEKKEQENFMKDINEAYNVLNDQVSSNT